MLSKRRDYDEVSAYSDFRALPAGGYICEVKQAKEQKNKNGGDMVVVLLDIIEGDYANYFMDLFDVRRKRADNPRDVKYPNDGIAYINVEDKDGNTNRKFKAFCTSIEESGGYCWDSNDQFMFEELRGAKIGVIFRREQHEYNGKMYWNTKPYAFRSVDTIIDGNYAMPDDLYAETQNNGEFEPPQDKFAEIEEDLPF